jgi:hypothetical protein
MYTYVLIKRYFIIIELAKQMAIKEQIRIQIESAQVAAMKRERIRREHLSTEEKLGIYMYLYVYMYIYIRMYI